MAQHNELGKQGEQIAVEFLRNNGYDILETNWVFQKAEVDIFAKKDNTLAVIEVKTRSSASFGLPQEFVSPQKIKRLVKAVNQYVETKNLDFEVRFDIIAIQRKASGFEVEHLEDAFLYF